MFETERGFVPDLEDPQADRIPSAEDLATSYKSKDSERVFLLKNKKKKTESEAVNTHKPMVIKTQHGYAAKDVVQTLKTVDHPAHMQRTNPQSPHAHKQVEQSTREKTDMGSWMQGKEVQDTTGRTYHIDELLGKGAMGFVVKATQKNGVVRAIKFVQAQVKNIPTVIERFEQEITTSANLQNPFVVQTIDRIEVDVDGENMIGLVTEFVEGHDLGRELSESHYGERRGRMSPERAAEFIAEVAVAIASMKEAGLVHRDIKPDNIFLRKMPDGSHVACVGDFGIVKMLDGHQEQERVDEMFESEHPLNLTGVGDVFGTPLYMAPEQVTGDVVSEKTDLYALGVMFYELLTGVTPVEYDENKSTFDNLAAFQMHPPRLFKEVGADDVPEALQALVFQMLEKNPDKRPANAREVYSKIKTWAAIHRPALLKRMPFDNQFDGIAQSHYATLSDTLNRANEAFDVDDSLSQAA